MKRLLSILAAGVLMLCYAPGAFAQAGVIEVPIAPGGRTTRYLVEVKDKDTGALFGSGYAQRSGEGYLARIEGEFPARNAAYSVSVTAQPEAGREGLDLAVTRQAPDYEYIYELPPIACCGGAVVDTATEQSFSGYGDGRDGSSYERPYYIYNARQLQHLNNAHHLEAGSYYRQMCDIDLAAEGYDATPDDTIGGVAVSGNWYPIGLSAGSDLSAYYDGNFHLIKNVSFDVTNVTNTRAGIFSTFASGEVKNLGVVNCTVRSHRTAGPISSNVYNASNCFTINCSATSTSDIAGGVFGNTVGPVRDCFGAGSRASGNGGNPNAGGITGASASSPFNRCYAVADLVSATYRGGISGRDSDGKNSASGCYYCNPPVSGGGTMYLFGTNSSSAAGAFSFADFRSGAASFPALSGGGWSRGTLTFSAGGAAVTVEDAPILAAEGYFPPSAFTGDYTTGRSAPDPA